MKENKGKCVDGDKVAQSVDEAIDQTCPPTSFTIKLIPPTSSEKRKMVSKRLIAGNLPSRRGNKKLKVKSSTPSITFVVVLDHATPMAKPKVGASHTRPDVDRPSLLLVLLTVV